MAVGIAKADDEFGVEVLLDVVIVEAAKLSARGGVLNFFVAFLEGFLRGFGVLSVMDPFADVILLRWLLAAFPGQTRDRVVCPGSYLNFWVKCR